MISVYVLLLALGVSGSGDDSEECDVASQLATRVTKVAQASGSTYLISEFEPSFLSPEVEISGPPGAFSGCLWIMNAAGSVVDGHLIQPEPPIGVNGLLLVLTPFNGIPAPFTIFLSQGCPPPGFTTADSGVILAIAQTIYDAIGVPTTQADEASLASNKAALGLSGTGTDLKFTGQPGVPSVPGLVFRDASEGAVYVVQVLGDGPVFDANANQLAIEDFDNTPVWGTPGTINPSYTAAVIGDPHIHTLAGNHYTLLREGSFLLWQFALEKPQVKWQIYAHYAGSQSFTKGLLLVDSSGTQPLSMELTSEQCQWQAKSNSTGWSAVSDEVLVSGPSSMKLVGHQRLAEMKKVELFLANEKKPTAKLQVMCRKGHHINLKFQTQQKWSRFVIGELKGQEHPNPSAKMKISNLQIDAKDDHEFQVQTPWKELGGSSHAEQYLQNLDQHPSFGLIQTCDSEAEAQARALCQKHLGEHAAFASNSAYFKDCIFDVCTGAGEVAAEMAAEMLKF